MITRLISVFKSFQTTISNFHVASPSQELDAEDYRENLFFSEKVKAIYRSQAIIKALSEIEVAHVRPLYVVAPFKAGGGRKMYASVDGVLLQAKLDLERHRRSTKRYFSELYYQWEEFSPGDEIWSDFLQEIRAEYLEAERQFSSLRQRLKTICKRISLSYRSSDKRVELKKKHQVVFKQIDDEDPTK